MAHFIERRPGKQDITYREEAIIKNQARIVYREAKSFSAPM
jgi:hypothetical protein